MTSLRQRQMAALTTMLVNLQRLYVFDAASARVAGTAPDQSRNAHLEGWMDTVGKALGVMIHGQEVDPDALASLRPLAPWLKDEVELHYLLHDPAAAMRDQAAFGAAHVYASDNQAKAESAVAQALGKAEQADWLLQQAQRMMVLVQQANTAIASSAQGEPGDEVAQFIASHVKSAVGDESRIKREIDAIPAMLEGRDPGA